MTKKKKEEPVPVNPVHNDDYETENCLRTLMDAEKIKSDPAKMKKVLKLAKEKQVALKEIKKIPKSVDDLKDMRNDAFKKEEAAEGE